MRALLITLAVFILVLVGLDFGARYFATAQIEKALAAELDLPTEPDVSVGGFPFLYQAFRGDYGTISVASQSLTLGGVKNVNATITLSDVKIPFSDAIAGDTKNFTAGLVHLVASVPTSSLAAAAGQPNVQITPGPSGTLVLTSQVTVAGQSATVTATGDAQVRKGALQVVISSIDTDKKLSKEVTTQVRQQLSLSIPLSGVPVALTDGEVQVIDNQLVLTADAVNVTLDQLSAS